MNYNREQFVALIDAVEDQGGEHMDLECTDRTHIFERFAPEEDPETGDTKLTPTGKTTETTLRYCNNSAIFVVPYIGADDAEGAGPRKLMACAVEDDMGKWPRFAKAMEAA